MTAPIEQLSRHINRTLAKKVKAFFVVIDGESRMQCSSGRASYFGYQDLSEGQVVDDAFPFLTGLEQVPDQTLELNTLETPSGKAADVHLLRMDDGWGIAFLDATDEREGRRRYQQAAHELALLGAEREKLFQEISGAKAALESANRKLDIANRLKSRFIGRMSHEFRTPLSSVLGFADLAKEELGSPGRTISHLKAIERGANYLLNLVDNLVDQAVSEDNKLSVHPSSCDISLIVEALEELFHPMADQRGLTFAWWISSDIPPKVWLDEIRLRQVLVNLLGNAFKFTREGGITVSLDWSDERLNVTVEDTGPGIQETDIETLLEEFRQSSDGQHEGKGAGLGLSISREIVRLMGGEMEIDSPTSQGTCVRFSVEAPSRRDKVKATTSLEEAVVLVVDDDSDIRQLLQVFLSTAGGKVVLARDMDEALSCLNSTPPTIVVADMQLGEENGVQLILKMRRKQFKGPIVALSASDDETLRYEAYRAGCTDYVLKPLRRTEFLQRLESVLASN
ncbi:MAG: ATP-binding protein [Candidatus Sedimenticola sp. PURPLELP]